MNETPLTNEELTEAVRKLQSDVLTLRERLEERTHYHFPSAQAAKEWLSEPAPTHFPPTTLPQPPSSASMPQMKRPPSRLTT